MSKNIKRNTIALQTTYDNYKNRLTQDTRAKIQNLINLYEDRKIAQFTTADNLIRQFITAKTDKQKAKANTAYDKIHDKHHDKEPLGQRMREAKKENKKRNTTNTYSVDALFYRLKDEKREKELKTAFKDSRGRPYVILWKDPKTLNVKSTNYIDIEDIVRTLKIDKSTFTDKISFTPIVDISAPTIIHSGLTLKHSTVNIEPLEGVLFSNQFGAEADRDVAVFRNQTNYITMKGNTIHCNATSDDSIANLRLNPAGNIEFSNVILPAVGADLYRPSGNTSYNLRIRDLQGIWEFRNRTLTCRNASNENLDTLMEIQSLGQGQIRLGTASTAQVGIGANPNASYFLTVAGTSNFDVIRSATRLDLIGDMYVKGTGSDIVRPSGDANYTLRVRDTQAVWEFRNRNFRCMNPSNPSTGTEMILHDTGGDYRLRIGSTSDAEVGIGRQYNPSYFLTVGGVSNFNQARVENNLELLGEQLLNTNARIFQRADAFNSLNVISTAQF